MLFLPRQARDKHKENSKKDRFVAGTDRNSPLQSLSDFVLSYPVGAAEGEPSPTGQDAAVDGLTVGDASAMWQQAEQVAARSSHTIAQQMVANALVAEVVSRLNAVMDDE
jgi:DNA-binding MurR/RpiR family transcriptional regulator